MEENKAEKNGKKKALRWIIPLAAVLVIAGLVLGFTLGGKGVSSSSSALDEAKISRLSEEAQELYSRLAAEGSDSIELPSGVEVSPILYVNGEKTLCGGSISSDGNGEYIIVINEGATLKLNGTQIDGNGKSPNGIYVSPEARYDMASGSIANVQGHAVRVLGIAAISGGEISDAGTNWLMVDEGATAAVTGGRFSRSGEAGVITAPDSQAWLTGDVVLEGSAGNLVYNAGNMQIQGARLLGAQDYAVYNTGRIDIDDTDLTGAEVLGYVENSNEGVVNIHGGSMAESSADFIFNKGAMMITGTTFTGSRSTAIENRGSSAILTISDTNFDNIGKTVILNKQGMVDAENLNIVECGGIAIHNRGAVFRGKNVTVKSSGGIAFMQDFASDGDTSGAGSFDVDGFAIGFADDYGIRINGGLVTLSNGIVDKCTSYGLYVKNGNVTTNSCSFLGTTDTERNTVQIGLSGTRSAVVEMNDTNITGGARGITNHATLTFNSGRIYRNNCAGDVKVGGGINNDGTLFINGGSIEYNHATSSGGGIYNSGECTISGGSVIKYNKTDTSGGGIAGKGKLVIESGAIYGNSAVNYGGGIYCSGELTYNGGEVYDNYAWKGGAGIDVTGTASLLGGRVHDNTSTGPGGGIYTGGDGETLISGITVENNASQEKGGGGVYNLGWTRIESATVIRNNSCQTYGGGVANSKSTDGEKVGFMIIAGGTISGNTSVKNGGGVSNTGYLQFQGGLVEKNHSESYGGGMYNSFNLKLSGGTISGNTCVEGGGGLENTDYAVISGGTISGNTAEYYGGGVYNGKDANMILSGGTISGNTSNKGGGGLYTSNNLHMTGGEITKNIAGKDANGAGLYTSGTIDMLGGMVDLNETGKGSGDNGKAHDFYVYKGTTTLYDDASVGTMYRSSEASAIIAVGSNLSDKDIRLFLSKYDIGTQAINGTTDMIIANRDSFILPENKAAGLIIDDAGKLASGAGMVRNMSTGAISSFSSAVASANAGDTLKILGAIELDYAQTIDKALTIEGGSNTLTLTTASAGFTVNAPLTINGLNITSTVSTTNQAISNNSVLTLSNVNLSNLSSAQNGAAIRNNAGATLAVTGGSVSSCTNEKSGGYGVIHNSGTASFTGTAFTGNKAGSGGSIYNTSSGELHLTGCSFSSNSASTGKDLYLNGAVYLSGSIQSESAFLKADRLYLEGPLSGSIRMNVSGAYDGKLVVEGAADTVAASCGCFKIANTSPYYELRSDGKIYELTGEVMLSGGEDVFFGTFAEMAEKANQGLGNTLKLIATVNSSSDVTLSGVTLDLNGNTLNLGGGTTATFSNVTVKSDSSVSGHTIDNEGSLILTNCSLTGLKSSVSGGAVYNAGYLKMTGGSITGCVSSGSDGGGGLFNKGTAELEGVTISGCSAAKNGGGILSNSSGNTTLTSCTITSNTTNGNGGGIYVNGPVSIVNSTITGNTLSASNKYGPDVYSYNTGKVSVSGWVTIGEIQPVAGTSINIAGLLSGNVDTGDGVICIKIASGSFKSGYQMAVSSDSGVLAASVQFLKMKNGTSLIVGPNGQLTAP